MYNKSLRNLFLFAIVSYILVVVLIFKTIEFISYSYSFEQLKDNTLIFKAHSMYVGQYQKPEVYALQDNGKVSYDYFKPQLLSSTYSAKTVNTIYNKIREEKGLKPIKIRLASDNPRNPQNKANEFELELLDKFRDKTLLKYKEIKLNSQGNKVMYYATPYKPLEGKCMRCHSTPETAPKGLVDIYGDKNGFYEDEGSIKALISIEYPLTQSDNFIYKTSFLLSGVALIIYGIFIMLYIRYSKNINKKNEELEKLNLSLEDRVEEKIKELQKSNAQLKQQKNFLDTFIQTTPIPLFIKDLKGKYIDVNKKFCEFTGYSKDEIIGKSVYDVAPKNIADIYFAQDQKVFDLQENPQVYESKVINKTTQKEFIVMFYKSAFFDDYGEVLGLIGSVIDITTIKQLEKDKLDREKKFFEQSKKADMSEFLTNIAHQWRQPLSIISTAASGMQVQKEMGVLKDADFYSYCTYIDENAQYLSQTIDNFTNYMAGDIKAVDFNLKNDINNFIKLIDATIKENDIKVLVELEDDVMIKGYPNELIQCLINLFNNSKDAFVEKKIAQNKRYVFITYNRFEDEIRIIYKDSAGGIDKAILGKVFDPYFTTKHQSIGTGLGLYIVDNIIHDKMKGSIEVSNETFVFNEQSYSGTQFIITLPILD